MQFTDSQKEKIINNFLDWCEKLGYSDPDDPVRIDIIAGLPVAVRKPIQSIRFDVDLTKSKQNTTME